MIAALPTMLKRGDTVLVKASRGMQIGPVADAVRELELP